MMALVSVGLCAPAASQADQGAAQLLNVGATGITCLRHPCPHRGVYLPGRGDLQKRKAALLYADTDGHAGAPRLVAAPDIAAAVNAAWFDMKCVQVLGQFEHAVSDRPSLRIARLVGPCP